MTGVHDDYARAVQKAEALLAGLVSAKQAGDSNAERLAEEYRVALAKVERLMPVAEKLEITERVNRLASYARAVERGDRAEMDRLYEAMTAEDRAGVQHAHDLM